jgi:hypothetical protein
MGRVESEPILYAWGWHYQVPSLAAWMTILALLAVPIAKRKPRSWLILVPPVLGMVLWQLPMQLLSMPPSTAETIDLVLYSAVVAWALVWLVRYWFAGYHPTVAFFLVLTAVLAGGALFCLGRFGMALSDESLLPLIVYCFYVLSLAPAMTLSGYGSRGRCTVGLIALWLGLWIGFAVLASMLVVGVAGTGLESLPPYTFMFFLFVVIVTFVGLGCILYLINLPFTLAASRPSLYVDHLRDARKLGEVAPWRPNQGHRTTDDLPRSVTPTAKALREEDIAGPWQFYLDRASRTVTVDFKTNGTFIETIVPNQGRFIECPEGTWRLDGPWIHLDGYVAAEPGTSQSRTWWVVDTPAGFAMFGGDAPDPNSFVYMTRRLQPTHDFAVQRAL